MFIEVQFQVTFCIDRIIGHEFTNPRNYHFHWILENWSPRILIKPQYHIIIFFQTNNLNALYENMHMNKWLKITFISRYHQDLQLLMQQATLCMKFCALTSSIQSSYINMKLHTQLHILKKKINMNKSHNNEII